jgi:hypothetical protein
MNADYRVFDFVDADGAVSGEGVLLRQWEETRKGGMGWSWEETVPLGEGLPDADAVGIDGVDGTA